MLKINYYKAWVICTTILFFTTPYTSLGFYSADSVIKNDIEKRQSLQNSVNNGKIVVNIPRNCISGTSIKIVDASNQEIMTLPPSKEGRFQSPCTLICGGEYNVIPVHRVCKFSPVSIKVVAKCCPEYGEATFEGCSCNEAKGKILIALPINCIKNTSVKLSKPDGSDPIIIKPNSKGIADTGCILECNADYLVQPQNNNCTFSPESLVTKAICCTETTITPVTFGCSCEPEKTGKIVVRLSSNCLKGTTIAITDQEGHLITTLTSANSSGSFETPCILTCGENYTVVPSNPSCEFIPLSATVTAKCCPEYGQVSFQCSCEPADTGKIALKIPMSCLKGTTITVTKKDGTFITTLTSANSNGVLETNCQLICGQDYIATPSNENCSFTPSYAIVTAKCCPEYGMAVFECSCTEEDNGKIRIKIPTSCINGTSIRITKIDGTYVTTLTNTNASGFFETQCNLICGKTYYATPQNENCIFIPSSATVTAKCCPEFGQTEFQCSCDDYEEDTGKIVVKVATQCIYGTTITVTKLDGTYVTTLTNGNASGVFETTCSLKCGETYRVTPSNTNYTFTPSSVNVTAKCCPEYGYATFSCCSCPPEELGKIVIRVPVECVSGTKITITELNGDHVMTLRSGSSSGVYETDCVLVCERTYRIIPSNENFNFAPSYANITAKCCPNYGLAFFDCCDCPEEDTGKISVKIPVESVKNTKVFLVDSNGKSITLPNGNVNTGIFESSCSLVCDAQYTVYIWNPGYYFSPFSQKVTAKCCPDYGYVSFKSTKKISMKKHLIIQPIHFSLHKNPNALYLWSKKFDLSL